MFWTQNEIYTTFFSFSPTNKQINKPSLILPLWCVCAIWYHLYNVKNVKNTHGRVLLVVKMQADGQTQAICQLFPTNCLSVFRRGYTEIFVSDCFMKHSLMYITFNLISWNSYKICKKETSTIKKKRNSKGAWDLQLY